MKKPFLTVNTLIFVAAVLFSCSEADEILVDEEVDISNLIAITSDYYQDDYLYFSETSNILDRKPVTITYSDKSYDSMFYAGEMVSKILEFDLNKNLEWTTLYDYDHFDRISLKKVIPGPNNPITDVSRQKSISYDESIIRSEMSWSDGGSHKNTIVLNDKSFMVEDRMEKTDNSIINRNIFEYVNGNLLKHVTKDHSGETIYEQTFEYLDKKASKPYQYNAFLFGKEWQNNSSLNRQFGLGQFKSYEISENYISQYNSYSSGTGISISRTFAYEFDSDERITKQTENISWSSGEKYTIITSYFYENSKGLK